MQPLAVQQAAAAAAAPPHQWAALAGAHTQALAALAGEPGGCGCGSSTLICGGLPTSPCSRRRSSGCVQQQGSRCLPRLGLQGQACSRSRCRARASSSPPCSPRRAPRRHVLPQILQPAGKPPPPPPPHTPTPTHTHTHPPTHPPPPPPPPPTHTHTHIPAPPARPLVERRPRSPLPPLTRRVHHGGGGGGGGAAKQQRRSSRCTDGGRAPCCSHKRLACLPSAPRQGGGRTRHPLPRSPCSRNRHTYVPFPPLSPNRRCRTRPQKRRRRRATPTPRSWCRTPTARTATWSVSVGSARSVGGMGQRTPRRNLECPDALSALAAVPAAGLAAAAAGIAAACCCWQPCLLLLLLLLLLLHTLLTVREWARLLPPPLPPALHTCPERRTPLPGTDDFLAGEEEGGDDGIGADPGE